MGGLWEAAVKSMKYHLRRVVGQAILTYEEMTTLLSQIEGIMNSRPLCHTTSDESNPLTPAHFLIGHSITLLPDKCLEDRKASSLNRWQLVQQMTQHIWRRWNNEYLTSLQSRYKWVKRQQNLKVNDVVIVKDENVPPSNWILARITDTHPGHDGLVRVVTIKTQSGSFRRPITKLCLLPTESIDSWPGECPNLQKKKTN